MKYKRKSKKFYIFCIAVIIAFSILILIVYKTKYFVNKEVKETPEKYIMEYLNHIPKREYDEMYDMINSEASGNISREDFIKRNSAIYEGIEIRNMEIKDIIYDDGQKNVSFYTAFDTVAGNISFQNTVNVVENESSFGIVWSDSVIFPDLQPSDKVRVSITKASRGEILDRNGWILAGEGVASSVGIVPGKLEDRESGIDYISEILEIDREVIENKLSAKWVKEDSLVPIKTIPKVQEIDLISVKPDEDVLMEQERQEKLLAIPGVMITDEKVREYPLREAASHLIGYVQGVTAEDLEEHKGEGYTDGSVIGRTGMENLYEKELKGKNGCRIYIIDSEGNEKEELACIPVENGRNIQLTIDSMIQKSLYEQFKDDKGCSVAMNPYTGEVLALVSTPSYNANDFIMGMSDEKWDALNEDEKKPLYNRFRQVWCPGSAFKPITAAIGLESGAINPNEDYGNEGLSWQKDSSWGDYHVTTLHAYEPVVLENALIYSDNIYFAKAALKIGAEDMRDSLLNLGFQEQLPFEIVMSKSQYSNTENIETEIQLADSGYGQGMILVNPLHLACIYTAFCNEGNVVKPYLLYSKEVEPEYWISNAFSEKNANLVLEGVKKVINDSHGTGYAARREDILLAGKTGTAEIKISQDDNSGTELGWFVVFPTEKTLDNPIMIVSMVEDVKGKGGSSYVVGKDKMVLESWFGAEE